MIFLKHSFWKMPPLLKTRQIVVVRKLSVGLWKLTQLAQRPTCLPRRSAEVDAAPRCTVMRFQQLQSRHVVISKFQELHFCYSDHIWFQKFWSCNLTFVFFSHELQYFPNLRNHCVLKIYSIGQNSLNWGLFFAVNVLRYFKIGQMQK